MRYSHTKYLSYGRLLCYFHIAFLFHGAVFHKARQLQGLDAFTSTQQSENAVELKHLRNYYTHNIYPEDNKIAIFPRFPKPIKGETCSPDVGIATQHINHIRSLTSPICYRSLLVQRHELAQEVKNVGVSDLRSNWSKQ